MTVKCKNADCPTKLECHTYTQKSIGMKESCVYNFNPRTGMCVEFSPKRQEEEDAN